MNKYVYVAKLLMLQIPPPEKKSISKYSRNCNKYITMLITKIFAKILSRFIITQTNKLFHIYRNDTTLHSYKF